MPYDKTKQDEEPKHTIGGIISHAVKTMFEKSGDASEKEQSTDYHERRTKEELKETGDVEEKPSDKKMSMNVHEAEGNTPESTVTHPVLKTIMAKLNTKEEDEPASKGGYVGMSKV